MDLIIQAARKHASEWGCGTVQLWNPNDEVRRAAEASGGKYVERESSSITSLNWFGEQLDSPNDVEWVLNEKYAWC